MLTLRPAQKAPDCKIGGFRIFSRHRNQPRTQTMAKLPTVKIKFQGSFKTINESSFDPDTMELFNPAEVVDAPAGPVTVEAIGTMKKGEVREFLEAHGVEDIPGAVADMRTMAIEILSGVAPGGDLDDEPGDDEPGDDELGDDELDDDEDLLG